METDMSSSSEGGSDGESPSRQKEGKILSQKDPKRIGSFLLLLKSLPLNIRDFCYNLDRSLLENLSVEIVTDISSCFNLWQEFSPRKTLFDTWEFRLAFYNAYQFKPYFILFKNQFENLALLPLEYDEREKHYTWFGSSWQEENKFFVKDSIFIPLLLAVAPKPLYLNAIDSSFIKLLNFADLQQDCPKYILDLKNMKTSEDFLMNLSKNKRHGLRKDKRRIEKQNPKIIIDNFSDLDSLILLSKQRFSQKGEEADWEDPRRIEAFRQVIKLANRSYNLRMISIYIGDKPAGIDLVAIFNNCYHTLKCGYNVKEFPGIGNFINLLEIDDAISLGADKIDFLQNNYEWKDRWFQAIPMLKYIIQNNQIANEFGIKVRNFSQSDLSRVIEIENSCFSIYDAYPKERIEHLSKEHADDFWVAEKDGKVLGYVIAYNIEGFGCVYSIAIDPHYQHYGIGKLMVNYVINKFKQEGIKRASLEVRTTNSKAISFFQCLGFNITRNLKGYYRDNGDAYQMGREL